MADDVFQDNDVLNLPAGDDTRSQLGVASLMTFAGPNEALEQPVWEAIELGIQRVAEAFPSNRLWLCLCLGGPDNRVTRAKKLTGLMRSSGIELSTKAVSERLEVKDDGGCYFYGAINVSGENPAKFRAVVTPTSRSFLVSLPEGIVPDVASLASSGWWRGVSELEELRTLGLQIVGQEGILFRPFGVFDDREVGVDLLVARCQLPVLAKDAVPIQAEDRTGD
ncbi:MAG: hypothetical protein MJE77_11975 [Proteobacteria bacterium]|nr:hypothetical protein [Pseudomonadota bacterium]